MPLVLIETDYEPFTQRPLPTGNIAWLNPYTEETFLESLDVAGVASFERSDNGREEG